MQAIAQFCVRPFLSQRELVCWDRSLVNKGAYELCLMTNGHSNPYATRKLSGNTPKVIGRAWKVTQLHTFISAWNGLLRWILGQQRRFWPVSLRNGEFVFWHSLFQLPTYTNQHWTANNKWYSLIGCQPTQINKSQKLTANNTWYLWIGYQYLQSPNLNTWLLTTHDIH